MNLNLLKFLALWGLHEEFKFCDENGSINFYEMYPLFATATHQ